ARTSRRTRSDVRLGIDRRPLSRSRRQEQLVGRFNAIVAEGSGRLMPASGVQVQVACASRQMLRASAQPTGMGETTDEHRWTRIESPRARSSPNTHSMAKRSSEKTHALAVKTRET